MKKHQHSTNYGLWLLALSFKLYALCFKHFPYTHSVSLRI